MRKSLLANTMAALLVFTGAAQAALHDRGGGLIYDDVLNVTWLQDASYARTSGYDADGAMTPGEANYWADNLSYYDSVRNVTYDDWRLPAMPRNYIAGTTYAYDGSAETGFNITSTDSPLAFMFYVNLGNSGVRTNTGALTGCGASCLANTGPFINVLPNFYHYYRADYGNPTLTWVFHMGAGEQLTKSSSWPAQAWAVRNGDVAAVPEPETWALLLAGLGILTGVARRRAA